MTSTRTPVYSLRPPARLRLQASPFSLTFSRFLSPSFMIRSATQAGTCAQTAELTHDPPPIHALAVDYLDICCYSAFTDLTADDNSIQGVSSGTLLFLFGANEPNKTLLPVFTECRELSQCLRSAYNIDRMQTLKIVNQYS